MAKVTRSNSNKIIKTIEVIQDYINLIFTGIVQLPVYIFYLISQSIMNGRRELPLFRQLSALGGKMCREITAGYFIKAIKK